VFISAFRGASPANGSTTSAPQVRRRAFWTDDFQYSAGSAA